MLVAAFITLTTVLAIEASRTQSGKLWIAAYAACAFGVLSKGLIGVVLPAGTFALWALLVERAPARIWQALSLPGMLLFAALVVPWFVAVEHSIPGFLRYFLVYQHFERYTQTGFNNAHGLWFYPAALALGLLPWIALCVPAVRSALSGAHRRVSLLALCWFLWVLIFFSLPHSKLIGYIFPLLPAAALLLGPWIGHWRHRHLTAVMQSGAA